MIDAVRDTSTGRLILGSGFDPRDLISYTIGVLIATLLEWGVRRKRAAIT